MRIRHWLFIFLAYHALIVVASVRRYDGNLSAMIHFGHYYVEQNSAFTPNGATRFTGNEENGGNGYDGQIFYYFARTLFVPGAWPEGFNNAYRAPRIGYPLLIAPFAVGGAWGTVLGM